MSARPAQSPDIAAILYIKRMMREKDRNRSWLASRSGIPYQTLRKYLDGANSAISIGDLTRLLGALQIPLAEGVEEINRMGIAIDEAEGEPDAAESDGVR
jgi:hypothetical protein